MPISVFLQQQQVEERPNNTEAMVDFKAAALSLLVAGVATA